MQTARHLAPVAESIIDERIAYLRDIHLFKDVINDQHFLTTVAALMYEKHLPPNNKIVAQGEMGSCMYFLMEGRVSIYKSTPEGDEFKVVVLSAKDKPFFGEAALLEQEARSASIYSDTQCKCLVLEKQAFDQFALQYPGWALPIFKRIAATVMSRLKQASHDFAILYKALVSEIRGHYT